MSLSDADAYDRFMGRFSRPLAVPFADFAGLPLDGRVLDVGCGPGALTAELCRERLPEPPFVTSAKAWVARGAA